ncbi:MAG: C-terminal target protein, partial [Flavipsychrobacter sp.]|nr:C-terminal target protein [Flavipsychrobacter sp.]
MKQAKIYLHLLLLMAFGLAVNNYAVAQTCVTPVITSITNNSPVCEGGTITLSASGTIGGVSSAFIRMVGVGANAGNQAFNQVFSSGDRTGTIARISNGAFDAIIASGANNAAKATLLKAQYDVVMFTWASPHDANISWGLIQEFLNLGGSVFIDGDYANIGNLNVSGGIVGMQNEGSSGCSYVIVAPAPFPSLVANGINGCFVNNHLSVSSWPSWMHAYIKASDNTTTMAIAGIYPSGNHGRLIVQGPDQDYHAYRGASSYPWGGGASGNQYQIILNQVDFLSANMGGFTWSGPNGFTSNEASPMITNATTAMAGVYTATLTNTTGGGCYATASTTVTVNALPSAGTISGNNTVFAGYTTSLSSTVSGGSWSSSNTGVATVNSSGVVTGVTAGNATITYTVTSGACTNYAVYGVTVFACGNNAILTYNFTNTVQTWTVPSGVNSVDITVLGAEGGDGYYNAATYTYGVVPGKGGKVTASLAVTPGQVLNLYVGGRGQNFTNSSAHAHGGFNGGGDGGDYGYYSGGGGGASDIRIGGTTLSNRVVVAGGGGGIGYGYFSSTGSNGGGLTGQAGGSYNSNTYASGGGGGTQSAGGAGGVYPYGTGPNYTGSNGSSGNGGGGAYYYAGGGGGGYYGGGGGGYLGNGGGGSSYTDATLATSVVHTQGFKTGNGQIVIAFPQSNVVITSNPSNTTVCSGTTASFSASGSISIAPGTISYQWQVNSGSGWSNISGATASTYSFTASSTDDGNQYRAVVSSVCAQVTNSNAATLTVIGTPVITVCPGNVSANNATGTCAANVTYGSATVTGSSPTVTYSHASGSSFNVGTTTVTVSATNSCGTATCTFDVTVTDNENPTATCQNYTLNLSGGTGTVTASNINNGSSDNCGIASMSVSPNTFTCADAGTHTVTLTVTDGSGNSASCTATVTVQYQPSCTISITPSSSTYTGGIDNNIYLGYGSQSATIT